MLLQIGGACLCIWIMNWIFIICEILKYTTNWLDEDVDGEKIFQNFLMNAPFESIMNIEKISQINSMMFVNGIILLMFGIIL